MLKPYIETLVIFTFLNTIRKLKKTLEDFEFPDVLISLPLEVYVVTKLIWLRDYLKSKKKINGAISPSKSSMF